MRECATSSAGLLAPAYSGRRCTLVANRPPVRLALLLLVTASIGCSSMRPIVYANDKYRQVGQAGADRDIDECLALAEQAGATPGSAGHGENVVKGATAGAAGGAVGGAISGGAGAGAAAGAAGGAAASLLWGWMTPKPPSEVHVNYVNQCLADRGYQVAGWK
jgi:hypothetical protein